MTPNRQRWTLPDDGIIDHLAIQIAASGTRPVALTRPERRLAAAAILAKGGTLNQISRRLHIGHSTARALAAELTTAATDEPGTVVAA